MLAWSTYAVAYPAQPNKVPHAAIIAGTLNQRRPVQVPEGNPGSVCRVGHTADGRFLACGNGKGDVYVYDAIQGDCITHLRPRRVSVVALL